MRIALCSMSPRRRFVRFIKKLKAIMQGIATVRPSIVAFIAVEIPAARRADFCLRIGVTDGFEGTDEAGDGAEEAEQGSHVRDRREEARTLLDRLSRGADRDLQAVLNQAFRLMGAKQGFFGDAGDGLRRKTIAECHGIGKFSGQYQVRDLIEETLEVADRVHHEKRPRAFDHDRDRDRAGHQNRGYMPKARSDEFKKGWAHV